MSPEDKNTTEQPETSVSFVHTADLHLDSPLSALSLKDPALAELVGNATRATLTRIVNLCIEHKVHALLIAGDIYDGDQKSVHTAAAFLHQMRRLKTADIQVFIIRGNHDAKSGLGSALAMPENVHEFDGRGGKQSINNTNAVVHGVSFSKAHAKESLLPKFKPAVANHINIGMLHTSLAGSSNHDVYAPCSLNELINFGYDYWALGHIHKPKIHHEKPAIVMPGIPQGRDIGEDGPHSVSLVSINNNETRITNVNVCPIQFEHITVNTDKLTEWSDLLDAIESSLRTKKETIKSDQLICRITLEGSSSLSFLIERDLDVLLAFCRETGSEIGACWIETLKNKCHTETSHSDHQTSILPQLSALIEAHVYNSDHIETLATAELRQLVKKMPNELRHLFGQTPEEETQTINEYLQQGTTSLLRKLNAGKSDAN